MLRCRHCVAGVEHDDDINRYVHTDTDAVGCDLLNINSGRAEPDFDRLVTDATAALDERYTLLYLDRSDDGLTPQQIQVLLDGTNEWESSEFSHLETAESDAYMEAATQVLRELLGEELYELAERADRLDEIRWAVEERDDSGGLVNLLLKASVSSLFRSDLGVDVPDFTMTSAEDDDTRQVIANAAGLDLDHPPSAALVEGLVVNASYGGRLYVLWYGDLVDAVALARPHDPQDVRGTVTFTGAHLLILDSLNGSGHAEPVPVITAQWGARRVSIDAARLGACYSWTDTAGPVASTYSGTFRLDRTATTEGQPC
jgi:hypothetical protein